MYNSSMAAGFVFRCGTVQYPAVHVFAAASAAPRAICARAASLHAVSFRRSKYR
jgi:hypothetical protein